MNYHASMAMSMTAAYICWWPRIYLFSW